MIGSLSLAALRVPGGLPAILGALAGVAVAVAPSYWYGHHRGSSQATAAAEQRYEARRAIAVTEALKTDVKAQQKSALERVEDAVEVADLKEELTDAVRTIPDALPSARRVALGCARLRNQGISTAELAACGGPPTGAEATTQTR